MYKLALMSQIFNIIKYGMLHLLWNAILKPRSVQVSASPTWDKSILHMYSVPRSFLFLNYKPRCFVLSH